MSEKKKPAKIQTPFAEIQTNMATLGPMKGEGEEELVSSEQEQALFLLSNFTLSPERSLERPKNKLLVLDINGLLADIVSIPLYSSKTPHIRIKGRSLFKRPFCDDFLNFCFGAFHVGVWSSRLKCNLDPAVDYLFGDMKKKLVFCWDQSKCTSTGFRTPENHRKPLLLKELKKIWEVFDGKWSSSNTLLIDDSPYKSLSNPPHTAIFPDPYLHEEEKEVDSSLGPGGDIRVYLQGLTDMGRDDNDEGDDDIRSYVKDNAIGQPEITELDSNWDFYQLVLKAIN